MAPIGPNGPGNPYTGTGNYLVPLRSTQALPRPIQRPLRPSRPGVARPGRAGRSGNPSLDVELENVNDDLNSPIDPTNKFRRRSSNPDQDMMTLSEYIAEYIDRKRMRRLLRIWPKNIADMIGIPSNWKRSFTKTWGEWLQYVDGCSYGYFTGGGY